MCLLVAIYEKVNGFRMGIVKAILDAIKWFSDALLKTVKSAV